MDPDLSILVFAILLVFFLLNAVFAAAVASYSRFSELSRPDAQKEATRRAKRLALLLEELQQLLPALKFGHLLSLVGFTAFAVLLLEALITPLGQPAGVYVATSLLILTLLMFIVNDLLVRGIVRKNARGAAEVLSLPVFVYYRLARPFVRLLEKLHSFLGIHGEDSELSNHRDLMSIVEQGEDIAELEDNERAMIHSIFEFGETEVHEIMVPRTDMVCVEDSTTLEELVRLMDDVGHSRIPLYKDDVDNILGIIHVKDLLPYMVDGGARRPALSELARPAYLVPESKQLRHLLKEFQRAKYHMAIVVDEYGGTAGLITLEDVIEEIVGDIQDEYDQEPPLYRKIDDNNYTVDAKIDLHELNESLNLDLPTEGEYESLGGFILSLTGYVPDENEVLKYKNYTFTINEVDRNRIIRVRVSVAAVQNEETGEVKS